MAFAFQNILQLWNQSSVVSIASVVETIEIAAENSGRSVHGISYHYVLKVGDILIFLQKWKIRQRCTALVLRRTTYEDRLQLSFGLIALENLYPGKEKRS